MYSSRIARAISSAHTLIAAEDGSFQRWVRIAQSAISLAEAGQGPPAIRYSRTIR